ncbi:hypothetical protein [Cystobacter fuscus]|uniref:hypothetical protein n=1 Tax=Cystobacter fuscus TaxID=43 RepID=UPI0037BEF7AA
MRQQTQRDPRANGGPPAHQQPSLGRGGHQGAKLERGGGRQQRRQRHQGAVDATRARR